MSRNVVWDPRAMNDFDEILDFLTGRNTAAASATELKVRATLERLSHYSIGRRSRVGGHFEKPVTGTPYTIAYEQTDAAIIVIRIIHQRRDWPDDDWPQG